ncbi:MAG: AMMECR1 domain-containing protein [Sphingomonadales bacterium]|nr:AMMECR1 domain-containing protein [Sphingomonadales bacterium]
MRGALLLFLSNSFLLLPQVAERRGFDPERFLEETCRKAGLPRSFWREPGTTVLKFEAVHFEEDDFVLSRR